MIEGVEWLFIALIIVLLVLWDPQKIPKIARALAEARREYEQAASTMQELVEEVEKEAEKDSVERDIIEKAKSLGINTYGKTREEILVAMFKKSMEKREMEKEESSESGSDGSRNSLNIEKTPSKSENLETK